jgi:hypothetical protein
MRLPSAHLREPIAAMRPTVLAEDYVVVYLPPDTKPLLPEWYGTSTKFRAIIRDTDQFVIVLAQRQWLRMKKIFDRYDVEGPFKVIDMANDASKPVPGYLAQIGAVMSEHEIRGFPISSFRRNHILVQKRDLPRAMKALREVVELCKKHAAKKAHSAGSSAG